MLGLVGESAMEVPLDQTAKDRHRISTYYSSLDKVIVEMESRFNGNDQDILCALCYIVLNPDASDEHYQLVASHYGVDLDLLKAEKAIYTKFVTGMVAKIPAILLKTVAVRHEDRSCKQFQQHQLQLPVNLINAYLRSTMGQTRLNSVAILNIERKYVNMSK